MASNQSKENKTEQSSIIADIEKIYRYLSDPFFLLIQYVLFISITDVSAPLYCRKNRDALVNILTQKGILIPTEQQLEAMDLTEGKK